MAVLSQNSSKGSRWSDLQIGRKYIDYLIAGNNYDKAAKLCFTVFSNDKTLWEEQSYKFAVSHKLRFLYYIYSNDVYIYLKL